MINRLLKYYPFAPLLLVCGFYIFKAIDFPIHDFANYYFGAKFLADGTFSYKLYFPYEFNKAIYDLGFHNIFVSYAPNTPFLSFFFLPLTFFTIVKAKILFNFISIILLTLSIYRLFDFYKINFKYVILIPILLLVPIKNNLLFGQVYFLLFFLLSEGLIAYEKKHYKRMSVFLGLAILLKVFPVLLFAILILKKQLKPFLYLGLSCLLLLALSLLLSGTDVWFYYLHTVLPKASNGEISGSFVDNYQSVFMFLKKLLVFDSTENPNALFDNPILFSSLITTFKLTLITVGYYITRKVTNTLFIFSYWILVCILFSPYGSTYGFILLIFPFITILNSTFSGVHKGLFTALLFIVCSNPLSFFIESKFPFSYARLFVLVSLFIIFISQFSKQVHWKKVIGISIIPVFFFMFFKKNKTLNSKYLLGKNTPILIYDYILSNNKLTYYYWNENGENSQSIPFKAESIQKLQVIENQLYHNNKCITSDKSQKIKPILINDKIVLYLSDYDKGIGFYALRKINLSNK